MDRESGMLYESLTYPMTRPQYLLCKGIFSILLGVVEGALIIAGAALILKLPLLWDRLLVLALAMVVGTALWFSVFSILALQIKRNNMFQTVINPYFVLLFVSNMFYPLSPLPGWLQAAAWANPITWQVDVFRYATLDLAEGNVLLESASSECPRRCRLRSRCMRCGTRHQGSPGRLTFNINIDREHPGQRPTSAPQEHTAHRIWPRIRQEVAGCDVGEWTVR